MNSFQAMLDAVRDDTLSIRPGTAAPDTLWSIDFFSADAPPRRDAACLLDEAELPALAAQETLPAAVFFVACAGNTPPPLPPELPAGATVVFVRSALRPLYGRLNAALDAQRVRGRIDDILLMADNAQFSPEQLAIALSQMLQVGVFLLNGAFQFVCGAAQFSGNPYSEELARDGVLSYDSVRAIRGGGETALLHEGAYGVWAHFHILLLWRPGARIDAAYLCRRAADYIIAYRSRNILPDVPPFLIDQRLNRVLEGKTTDDAEIRSFFGGGAPVWYSVLVLGYEPGVRQSAEAFQRQAYLLRACFRSISITVVRAQVCAVIQLPIRDAQDNVYSRDFFDAHAFQEGWDTARLARELQQCGAYLCHSAIFKTLHYFHTEFELVFEALDVAIKLESCRGRRIVSFQEYSSFITIKFALERYLQKFDPVTVRAVLHPELVTLLFHDFKNDDDLAEVLYRYYTYGDVKATAQSLFVHRNTVYNKLKTIQTLLQVDLDDPGVRSSFLTSLRVYYYCERCLGLDLHTMEL